MVKVTWKATGEQFILRDGKTYTRDGTLVEIYKGQPREVVNSSRSGWWRFNEHYDRDGYCDNPARGY